MNPFRKAIARILRSILLSGLLRIGGRFHIQCFRADGSLRWSEAMPNGFTNVGLNHILDVAIKSGSQIATWYIGLIDNDGVSGGPTLAAADTLSSHAGWLEASPYAGDRPAWTPGAVASQSVTNGTSVDISVNATKTLYGAFLASAASGTAGTLLCTAAFASTREVQDGDTLKLTYTLNASAS